MKLFLLLLPLLGLTGCVGRPDIAPARLTPEIMQQWATTCALCHVEGVGGAPRVGVSADWTERLAQGTDMLMRRTIEGFNDMPPLGYCMSCEADDFAVLIDFMSRGAP
jgi:cytochrome c5